MLLDRVLSARSLQVYSISQGTKEYKRMKRTLTGENKSSDFSGELINEVLMKEVSSKFNSSKEVVLIHDPSDLRKEHSTKLESLGCVRSLDNKIINGYSTFNTIAIDLFDQEVNLLRHECYSNRQENFLSCEEIKALKKEQVLSDSATLKKKKLYDSDDYINKERIATQGISEVSHGLKVENQAIKITHILDREFDNEHFFSLISDNLQDQFIIRLKKNRTLKSLDEKLEKIKIIDHDFNHNHTFLIPKLVLKGRVYQDVKLKLFWDKIGAYQVVKVLLYDSHNKLRFKEPMILITNWEINNQYDAYQVYSFYLKRSRIESVFKFMKTNLGWEEFRLQDFDGIKNLVAIGFFVAAYLYELEEEKKNIPIITMLAKMGRGKGKITRHFIYKGLGMLLIKYQMDKFIEEEQIPPEMLEEAKRIAGINDEDYKFG